MLLTGGPLIAAAGMLWLSLITPDGGYWTQVFGGLLVVGAGIAFVIIPVQNVALTGVRPHDAGAASALVNSAMQIGGCVGLSVFTTIYLSATERSVTAGGDRAAALTDGYSAVFLATAVTLIAAALVAATTLRGTRPTPTKRKATEAPVPVG
ncbi:hypothetical protein SHKM778_88890 [Streptomyces sp. KM77-8]|uniref:MFS transporter n=1 Tax=Streptomyces haneummycinicus TaxID=3074435 RepID=A0AAT9HYM4_9ACTN